MARYSQSRNKGARTDKSKPDFDDKDFKDTKKGKVSQKHKSGTNDPAWYTRNPQLTLDAGRLSFNVPVGSPILWDTNALIGSINNTSATNNKVPSVCRLGFVPTYGITTSAADPLNVAARSIYAEIRKANSGSWNYDPNDLMIYLMAMDNIYMYYQRLCRIYGVMRLYSRVNRAIPRIFGDALRFDFDDVNNHLSDFRAYINSICARINSLNVPGDLPLYARHMWMTSGLYQDAPTGKCQFYVFDPIFVGKYNERTSTTGGFIESVNVNTANATIAQMTAVMDSLLNAVLSSESCGIISGDIAKAMPDRLYNVVGIGDDYVTLPTYDIAVLRQIQNATVFNDVAIPLSQMVYQDLTDNILKSDIELRCLSSFYEGNRVMTGSDAVPDPSEVIESSRLMVTGHVEQIPPTGTPSATNPNRFKLNAASVGTEVIARCEVYGMDYMFTNQLDTLSYMHRDAPLNMRRWMAAYAHLDFFNYHPRVGNVVAWTAASDGTVTAEEVVTYEDVDNYTVIGESVLYNLHMAALLSQFNIVAV